MSRAWLAAAGAGLAMVALLFALGTGPFGLFLVLLAPMPLFLVGLSAGVISVLIAGGVGALALLVLAGPNSALGMLGVLVVPVAVLVRQALLSRTRADGAQEWYPPGLLAAWLAGLGAAILLAICLAFVGAEGGIEAQVRGDLARTLETLLPQAEEAQRQEMAEAAAPFALGSGVTSWMLLLVVNGALAQGILAKSGHALRPSPDLAELRLPFWLSAALAAVALVAFLAPGTVGYLARNLVPVLVLPFFLAGLAVVHALARRVRSRGLLLGLTYGALILLGWPALLLAGVGMVDQLVNLRGRSGSTGEKK